MKAAENGPTKNGKNGMRGNGAQHLLREHQLFGGIPAHGGGVSGIRKETTQTRHNGLAGGIIGFGKRAYTLGQQYRHLATSRQGVATHGMGSPGSV